MSNPAPPTFIGGTGGLATRFLDNLMGDAIRGGGIIVRTETAIAVDFIKSITADAFDSLIEGEPHVNVGMSAEGMVNVVERFMRTVAYASMILTDEIAEEFYSEMIQEGFSNAVQTSVGGAFQSILNTWRGGYPLNYDEIEEVAQAIEDIDKDIAGLLSSQAGCNIPTTYFRLKRGFDRYIDDRIIALRTQLINLTERINDLVTWLHDRSQSLAQRGFDASVLTIREAYERAVRIIDDACERALSRLHELLAELKTVKAWWEWTLEHPDTPLLSESEKNIIAVENRLEAEATIETLNRILSSVDSSLSGFDIELNTLISKVDAVISKVISVYNKIVDKANALDLADLVDKLQESLNILLAYRNVIDSNTSLTTPVRMKLMRPYRITAYDVIRVYDSARLTVPLPAKLEAKDIINVVDSATLRTIPPLTILAYDSVSISDSAVLSLVPLLKIMASDTINVVDSAVLAIQPSAWLSGFNYRKKHDIAGSTAGAVTDYQIKVRVL